MTNSNLNDGILLLYHYPMVKRAPTIMEHVNAFKKHSRFKVWVFNTEYGFPSGIDRFHFQSIVLHYSLFGIGDYKLDNNFLRYLDRSEQSCKIAFFQDEYCRCQQRFNFINRFSIDCVYTLLDPAYFGEVYQKYTKVPKLVHTLTGYVNDDLPKRAKKFAKPMHTRKIDVGYRGTQLPLYMGKGSQEKQEIATRFREYASGFGLLMDLETEKNQRLYGDEWYKFLGNCRAFLGVEAGVSIFDIEDVVHTEYERIIAENPAITFDELSEQLLNRWEDNIPYRTISPRHFEAAAFRTCQILYEGDYQGIMKPMVHYIPLKKDFSNFDEVVRLFGDIHFRKQITENCYQDLIASGRYSYRNFVESFDRELIELGFKPQFTPGGVLSVSLALYSLPFQYKLHRKYKIYRQRILRRLRILRRQLIRLYGKILYQKFPGRKFFVPLLRPPYRICRRMNRYLKNLLTRALS